MNTHALSLVVRSLRAYRQLPIVRKIATDAPQDERMRHVPAMVRGAINRYAIATSEHAHVLHDDAVVEVMF